MVIVPVIFRFPVHLAPAAHYVSVVGSFNAWNPDAHRMRRATDDEWTISVYLPPGRAVYLFCVDGAMWLDPEDEGRLPNGWGSEYSVRRIGADPATMVGAEETGRPSRRPRLSRYVT